MKLAAFSVSPLRVFAVAHHDESIAKPVLQECLESVHQHPLLLELQSPPLSDEAREFLDGCPLADLPHLRVWIAQFKFGHSVERRIEGGHAYINRRAGLARNRSEAYDSLALRCIEIKGRLQHDHEFMQQLCDMLEKARSPKLLVHALGLQFHPALTGKLHPWDKVYRKVIYHTDMYTLYRCPPPELHFVDKGSGPGATATSATSEPPESEPPPLPPPAKPPGAQDAQVAQPKAKPKQPECPADVSVADYSEILRAAALSFMRKHVLKDARKEPNIYYSCRVPDRAIQSLRSKLGWRARNQQGELGLNFLTSGPLAENVWFSVVKDNPADSKRAQRGQLEYGDIAVSIHAVVAHEAPHIWLCRTPTTFQPGLLGSLDVQDVSLVLTTRLFSLHDLQTCECWEAGTEHIFVLSTGSRTWASDRMVSKILEAMLSGDPGWYLRAADGSADDILDSWAADGLAECNSNNAWVLTSKGKSLVFLVCEPQKKLMLLRFGTCRSRR